MLTQSLILFALFCISNGEDGYLPPYIQPCDISDSKFPECMKGQMLATLPHFTKGIPELGVPSLDPVHLDDLKIDGNGLKLIIKQALMNGVSTGKVTDFDGDFTVKDSPFRLTFKANLELVGQYEIDGRILVLPIQGQGDARISVTNVVVHIDGKLSRSKDNKGLHFKLTSPSYNYTIEKTKFEFQNLFNGNKQLSDATHQFANENWKQLMDDLAPPVIKQIVRTCIKSINKFFAKVTINQIVRNYKE